LFAALVPDRRWFANGAVVLTRPAIRRGASFAACIALVAGSSACGDGADGPSQPASRDATAQPQFLHQPIVVFNNQGAPPDPIYRVYLRTDRALPRDRHGARGSIEIDEISTDYPRLFTVSRRKYCYWTHVHGIGPLASPREGREVEVTLRVLRSRSDGDRARVRIAEVSPSEFDDDDAEARLLRKLGCPHGNL
jgi:hypothetical protein